MKTLPIQKIYLGKTVLDLPALTLEPDMICAVVGANGSGKSTFAKIVAGVIPAEKKEIWGADKPRCIGYLPQKSYAFQMSLMKNVLLSTQGRPEDIHRARELLEQLKLTELSAAPAHRLSGGETARMAMARLMIQDYDLLLLDEPTAAMDMETTILTEQLIRDYRRRTGCLVLLITHSLKQAERLADRVMFFHQGQLIESGPCRELLVSPQQQLTAQFLDFYGV